MTMEQNEQILIGLLIEAQKEFSKARAKLCAAYKELFEYQEYIAKSRKTGACCD